MAGDFYGFVVPASRVRQDGFVRTDALVVGPPETVLVADCGDPQLGAIGHFESFPGGWCTRRRLSEYPRIGSAEERNQDGRLVCFEVDGWEGSRSLGGWGGTREPTSVTLLHGDIERDDSWVTLRTRENAGLPDPPRFRRRDDLVRELLHTQSRPPEGLDIEQMHRWLLEEQRRIDQIQLPSWLPVIVSIDGHNLPGEVVQVTDGWALVAARNGTAVELFGKGPRPDTIALTRVTTLQPYIDGLRTLQKRRSAKQ